MLLCKGSPFELDSDRYLTDFADDMCIFSMYEIMGQLDLLLTGPKAVAEFGLDTVQKIGKILQDERNNFIKERKFISIVNKNIGNYTIEEYNIKERLKSVNDLNQN